HELGLITDEEYAPLRDRHEARALLLYREIDELAGQRRSALASAVAREKAALVAQNGAWTPSLALPTRGTVAFPAEAGGSPALPAGRDVPRPLPVGEGRGEGSSESPARGPRPDLLPERERPLATRPASAPTPGGAAP